MVNSSERLSRKDILIIIIAFAAIILATVIAAVFIGEGRFETFTLTLGHCVELILPLVLFIGGVIIAVANRESFARLLRMLLGLCWKPGDGS